MSDWKDTLAKIAPIAATVLGSPFAGLAVSLVGQAIGTPDATVKTIQQTLTNGQLTGDQIIALKNAELDLQKHLQDNGIELDKIAADDRASARAMQTVTKSYMPSVVTIIVLFFAALGEGSLLLGYEPHIAPELVGRILGTLDTAVVMALTYWLGTTASSARKTEILANQP